MSQLFLGTYSTMSSSNLLLFTTSSINKIGNLQLIFKITNSQSSTSVTNNVTSVSTLGLCNIPTLSIINQSALFYQPTIYLRSSQISLTSATQLNCNSSSSNTKQWYVYSVDPKTGSTQSSITLANNPTLNYADLVIQPNILNYGVYKIVYQVTMAYDSVYTSQVETFIQIKPSGLLISTLNDITSAGTYELQLGANQSLTLDPVSYSTDIDSIADISRLNFSFYCRVIDSGVSDDYLSLNYGINLDLLTLKNNFTSNSNIQALLTNNSKSCFDSISELFKI